MKIRKLKFQNHPVLDNFELDFTDRFGKTINTILIAGENGVGKSVLLNVIFSLTKIAPRPLGNKEKKYYELELTESEIDSLKFSPQFGHNFSDNIKNNIISIEIDYGLPNDWNSTSINFENDGGKKINMSGNLFAFQEGKSILRILFSDVEINFTSRDISTVTTKNIDRKGIQSEKSNANLATDITQLLIDIQSMDALEFTEWARQNSGKQLTMIKVIFELEDFHLPLNLCLHPKNLKG